LADLAGEFLIELLQLGHRFHQTRLADEPFGQDAIRVTIPPAQQRVRPVQAGGVVLAEARAYHRDTARKALGTQSALRLGIGELARVRTAKAVAYKGHTHGLLEPAEHVLLGVPQERVVNLEALP